MMEASMGDVVNLKRFKKRTEREQSAKQAEGNRTRFGRTKSERVLEKRRTKRASELLDQHRIEGEDAS
jgi:YD repeat-containing protein